MANISYVNGLYCNIQQAKISINDRGYHFGDAVYEVILYNNGIFYDYDGHINRLFNSLKLINIKFHLSAQQLKIIIKNLFRLNRVNFGSIYIQVSRGVADRNHSYFGLNSKPILTMIVSKKKNNISDVIKGVKAITMVDNRWSRPDIKTTQLLPNVLAKTYANKKNAYEGIFIDHEGYVTEGSSSNIWIINKNNEILTREIDGKILSGITRKTISQFAKNNNFKMLEKKFTKDEMLNSREVFLTSASSFVTPIIEIDNIKIGNGMIGKTSIELRNLYFKNFN
jgi:D-alanine transaminase